MNKFNLKWLRHLNPVEVFKELHKLSLKEKIWITVIGVVMILVSLFDWSDNFKFNFTNLKGDTSFGTFQNVMRLLAGLTAFSGILCVYLIAIKKISNYFWGIMTVILYGISAFANAYTGDAMLNILFFLPANVVGLYLWSKHMNAKTDEVIIAKMKIRDLIITVLILASLTAGFWFLIPVVDEWLNNLTWGSYSGYAYADKVAPHLFDAFTNAASIIAMTWGVVRFKEQWPLWVVINIIQLAMWCGIGPKFNVAMIVMWSVFLLNSGYGVYVWYKKPTNSIEKI